MTTTEASRIRVIRSISRASLLGLALVALVMGPAAFGSVVLCVMPDGTAVIESAVAAAGCRAEIALQKTEGLSCAAASDSCTDILLGDSVGEAGREQTRAPQAPHVSAVLAEQRVEFSRSLSFAPRGSASPEKRLPSNLRRSVVLQI